MKKRTYLKPACEHTQVELGGILASSIEGGLVGGTTNHFDSHEWRDDSADDTDGGVWRW